MRRMKRILPCLLAVLLLLSGCGMPKAEEPKTTATTAVTSAEPEEYTIAPETAAASAEPEEYTIAPETAAAFAELEDYIIAEPWTDTATDFRGVLEKYYSAEELGVEDGIYAEIRLWPLRSSVKAGLYETETVRLPDGMMPDDLNQDDLVEVLCAADARDEDGYIRADEIRTVRQSPARTEWAANTRYGLLYNVTPYLPPEPESENPILICGNMDGECTVNVGEGNVPLQEGERNFEPECSYQICSFGVVVYSGEDTRYFAERRFYELMANGLPTGRMIADESYLYPWAPERVPGKVIFKLDDVVDTVRNVAVRLYAHNFTSEAVDLTAIHAVSLEHEENGAWVQLPIEWVYTWEDRYDREHRVAQPEDFESLCYYIEPEDPTLMMTGKFRLTLENGESFEFVLMNECFVDRRLGQ